MRPPLLPTAVSHMPLVTTCWYVLSVPGPGAVRRLPYECDFFFW